MVWRQKSHSFDFYLWMWCDYQRFNGIFSCTTNVKVCPVDVAFCCWRMNCLDTAALLSIIWITTSKYGFCFLLHMFFAFKLTLTFYFIHRFHRDNFRKLNMHVYNLFTHKHVKYSNLMISNYDWGSFFITQYNWILSF